VQRQMSTIEQRRDALHAQLAEVDAELESYARRKQLLEELVFVEQVDPVTEVPRTASRPIRRAIKGAELRRVAARQLWTSQGEQEVHYRDWFERLIAAGYAIGGKDPLASFLTNIRDSPAVTRGSRQGYYRLDPRGAGPLEQQLNENQAELADVEESIERAYAAGEPSARIESLREHRSRLRQVTKRVEAKLDEVRYVFHDPEDDGAQREQSSSAALADALRAA
jgi:hypothetical protein